MSNIYNTIRFKKKRSNANLREEMGQLSPGPLSLNVPKGVDVSGPIPTSTSQIFNNPAAPSPWKSNKSTGTSVSPVPYETWAQQKDVIEEDPLKDLLLFPDDELEFKTQSKKHRTEASKIANSNSSHCEKHVQDIIHTFCVDFKSISNKYSYQKAEDLKSLDELPEQEYEADLWGSSGDLLSQVKYHNKLVQRENEVGMNTLHYEYITRYVSETDKGNAKARGENRVPLFQCYEPKLEGEISAREVSPLYFNKKQFKFMVNANSLSFALGEMEPFYGSLALYNVNSKQKISENFYFDVNGDHVNKYLEKKEIDPETNCLNCVFSVAQPNPDIYLVLKIEKVFQGEIEASCEPYTHSFDKKADIEKAKKKIVDNVSQFCTKYGEYSQAFGWCAIPIFKKDSLVTDGEVSLETIYRYNTKELSDIQLIDSIVEMRDHLKTFEKRTKQILGFCRIKISEIKDEAAFYSNYRVLDTSLYTINQNQEAATELSRSSNIPLLKEVQEFPETPYPTVNTEYINNLYVYPQYVSFQKGGKNIGVKVALKKDDGTEETLKVVYGKSKTQKFLEYGKTHVTCNHKQPEYYEEIKIALPAALTGKHHLLFTFFNLVTKSKKGMEDKVEVPIGYSFLTIYKDGKFIHSEHELPVCILKPEEHKPIVNYLNNQDLSYHEGGKPLFGVNLKLVSTVYTQHQHLSQFLLLCRKKDIPSESVLQEAVLGLREIDPVLAINYMNSIFNGLLSIISLHLKLKVATESLQTLIIIASKIHAHSMTKSARCPLLVHYVTQVFDMIKEPKGDDLYHALASCYMMNLMEKKFPGQAGIKLDELQYCWFVFEIIIKSMTLKLTNSGEIYAEYQKRSSWFTTNVVLLLKKLITFLSKFFQEKCVGGFGPGEFKFALDTNKYLAWFVADLFSVLDRGEVLDMVWGYIEANHYEDMDGEIGTKLIFLKFDFLRIVLETYNYVQLNFPVPYKIDNVKDLYDDICARHPFASIVIHEIKQMIMNPLASLRTKGISTLTNLIYKHDLDIRYQSQDRKQRIAGIYFPLILMLLDNWTDPKFKSWRETSELVEKRALYICVVWVLKNHDKHLLKSWWKRENQDKVLSFCNLLGECIVAFEYQASDEPKATTDPSRRGSFVLDMDTRNDMVKRRTHTTSNSLTPASKDITPTSKERSWEKDSSLQKKRKQQTPQRIKRKEAALNFEATITVLEVIERLSNDFKDYFITESQPSKPYPLMDRVCSLYVLALRCMESIKFFQHLFASLRSFIVKFREVVFLTNPSYCAELCTEMLRLCGYGNYIIRDEATSLLYLMIKNNQQFGTFRRISVQLTTALAKLVSEGVLQCDPSLFESTLSRLCSFAIFDYSMPDSPIDIKNNVYISPAKRLLFVRQIEELTGRLTKIMKDTYQVKEHEQNSDAERVAELYARIAKGYATTPELRATWLQALSKRHEENENYTEAGVCLIHVAMIISLYLQQKNENIPLNLETFTAIVPHIHEVVEDEEEGLFSEQDLIEIVRSAISCFEKDEMYEYCVLLHKFLIKIFEHNHDYSHLSRSYDSIKKMYDKIIHKDETRMLGSYYRVGFYSAKLGADLHAKEFVYREPKSTHLFELKERLKTFYSKLFGEANVVVFPDSSPVDQSKLDPDKCYLQITHLDPYFTVEDLSERKTYFEKNTVISNFVFATPFTISGKAQGALNEQYLRKTIVNVKPAFPQILKRSPIIEKNELILTPIENAIEAMQKRNGKMLAEVTANPVDLKSLQSLLQGSVLALVNEGPIEICRQFLDNPQESPEVLKLQDLLIEFLKLCERALTLNKDKIGEDQIAFQNALEEGFSNLRSQMAKYLRIKKGGARIRGSKDSDKKRTHRTRSKTHKEEKIEAPAPQSLNVEPVRVVRAKSLSASTIPGMNPSEHKKH